MDEKFHQKKVSNKICLIIYLLIIGLTIFSIIYINNMGSKTDNTKVYKKSTNNSEIVNENNISQKKEENINSSSNKKIATKKEEVKSNTSNNKKTNNTNIQSNNNTTRVTNNSNTNNVTISSKTLDNKKVENSNKTTDIKKKSETKSTVVSTVKVQNITLDKTTLNLHIGETVSINATVLPVNATDKTVIWSSSNSNIVTVTNGKIKAIGVGTANIVAKTKDGSKTVLCKVTIQPIVATSIKLNYTTLNLNYGNSASLKAIVLPTNTTNKTITWSSSDITVANVNNNGLVIAKGAGRATITAKTSNGKIATVNVIVKMTSSQMKNSYSLLVSKNGSYFYAYAPSVMVKNGQTYIWSCQNKDSYVTRDHIYLNTTSTRSLALAPGSGWDSYHVCDPSVVEGNFKYNGASYKYAMAYTGINKSDCLGNDIGIALSNSLTGGWIKVGNSPLVDSGNVNRWGVGQPSLIYVNNKLILFYTNDIGSGSGMQVKIINPNTMKVESTGKISQKNVTWMHNADFAYKNNRLYVIYEGPEHPSNGDIIGNTLVIKSAKISNYTDINSYSNLVWEDENVISSTITGQRRNTNGGFFRTPTGGLYSRVVAFTTTNQGSGNGHYTYNIYKCNF